MADNDNANPATQGDDTLATSTGNDTLSGGYGNDTINGQAGNDVLHGDGAVAGAWHYETFDYDFTSAHGQAFDIENGVRTGSGYVTDFNEGGLTNTIRGTSGNPEDFGVVYTSTLDVITGGTYRFDTRSDDGSTIQLFDSNGDPVEFDNQLGGTLDYMNNDRHQGPTPRYGDAELIAGETYTIQIRYWENRGGDVLEANVSGPDTGNVSENLLTTSMVGLPPGPDYSILGTPAGVEGDDILNGGAGDDTIYGDGGDDTISGGTDTDILTGGDGNDTFIYAAGDGNDTITDFGTGATGPVDDGDQSNNDFVDLSDFYTHIFELHADLADDNILNQSAGDPSDNVALGGTLTLTGATASDLTFDTTNVACFTSGARIMTGAGPVPVEALREGMLVRTRDNGLQPVRALLSRSVIGQGDFAPVHVAAGTFGNRRDLLVSPQHRFLLEDWQAELMFDTREVLVPACHLINAHTVTRRVVGEIRYFHVLLDRHEIITADGSPSESYHPGDVALCQRQTPVLNEVLALFPDLRTNTRSYGPAARRSLKSFESRALLSA
ncbi:MAG: Hint domain-containing protein [Sedimentitalea sp.]